jgi:hypothetical protein
MDEKKVAFTYTGNEELSGLYRNEGYRKNLEKFFTDIYNIYASIFDLHSIEWYSDYVACGNDLNDEEKRDIWITNKARVITETMNAIPDLCRRYRGATFDLSDRGQFLMRLNDGVTLTMTVEPVESK